MKTRTLTIGFLLFSFAMNFTSCNQNKESESIKDKSPMTGVIFNDETHQYDGVKRTITATNYPVGSTVTYENAGPHDDGVNVIKVKITHPDYLTYEDEATLSYFKIYGTKITESNMANYTTYSYRGFVNTEHRVKMQFTTKLRKGSKLTFNFDYSKYQVGFVETSSLDFANINLRMTDTGWLKSGNEYTVGRLGDAFTYLTINLTDLNDTISTTDPNQIKTLFSSVKIDGYVYGMNPLPEKLHYSYFLKDNETLSTVAHRGAEDFAPENTIASMRKAKELGFKKIECDISWTKDGVAVLLHDSTVNRTCSGHTGNIADLNYNDIKNWDFGSWKSSDYTGEKIPTFTQLADYCKENNIHPYLEIKNNTNESRVREIVNYAKSINLDCTWLSINHQALTWVNKYDSTARLGVLCGPMTDADFTRAKNLKTSTNEIYLGLNYYAAGRSASDPQGFAYGPKEAIDKCKAANIPVEIFTLGAARENDILSLDPYITGVTTTGTLHADAIRNRSLLGL